MGKIGRTAINDVMRTARARKRVTFHKGKRVVEKRPTGVVAEFVHPNGNVGTHQLRGIGLPKSKELVDVARGRLHADGFVEVNRCPLRWGTHAKTPALEQEFNELFDQLPPEAQRPCRHDPPAPKKTARGIEIVEPCPHVRTLIADRVRRAKELAQLKRDQRPDNANLRMEEIALQREQLAEQRRTNEALLQHLTGRSAGLSPASSAPATSSAPAAPQLQPEITVDVSGVEWGPAPDADDEENLDPVDPSSAAAELEADGGDDAGDVDVESTPAPSTPKRRGNRRS
jgi:hypothetical protein